MYTSALSISLGLALLVQSLIFFSVFCIFLVLILVLISIDEKGLIQVYRERYCVYRANVKRLIPYLY